MLKIIPDSDEIVFLIQAILGVFQITCDEWMIIYNERLLEFFFGKRSFFFCAIQYVIVDALKIKKNLIRPLYD